METDLTSQNRNPTKMLLGHNQTHEENDRSLTKCLNEATVN